ncbi:HPr kinase/phosphorylase [Brevundimonas subvibrioides]|uniref:HPr kinase n=1 Tax=Brevundimonas subvibrioides (strain ATCC 15264 / DSM 4735 / LMG 14903 / NBRC 16000 / CB 81) TaxID=633149 RepID=D9QJ51_BRESC|nr:HPr kinase [Brevundimonas subvibrioides]ADK99575.1 HPr kinase [Brevundimonas subvibrioides ATCC 15264]
MTVEGTAPPIHATAVAVFGHGGWRGALLTGPSGAGKSDLALRLMARGWRLIGDDYVHAWASGGALFATAVEAIAGRMEARGLGIVPTAYRPASRIVLVVDCVQEAPERLPEPRTASIAGVSIARVALDIRPASAAETLALAIRRL